MAWSKFTDTYDEHENVEAAWFDYPPNPVGLHVMATTACNRWLSDGLVRPRWLVRMLPNAKKRRELLASMVEHRLFDAIQPGEIYEREDNEGHAVTFGPFDDVRYVVHDFLDHHDSARLVKERREADAARKREHRRKKQRSDSDGSPAGRPLDSARSPSLRADAGARSGARVPTRPDPTRPDPTNGLLPQPPARRDAFDLWADSVFEAGRRRRASWADAAREADQRAAVRDLFAATDERVVNAVMRDLAATARAGEIQRSLTAAARGFVLREQERRAAAPASRGGISVFDPAVAEAWAAEQERLA